MKFFMINNTFYNAYYAKGQLTASSWVGIDSQEEVPVLFATRKEADKFIVGQKYYLEQDDDRWQTGLKVVEVEVNL